MADLKKNMNVTLHLQVQDGIWVDEIDAADWRRSCSHECFSWEPI